MKRAGWREWKQEAEQARKMTHPPRGSVRLAPSSFLSPNLTEIGLLWRKKLQGPFCHCKEPPQVPLLYPDYRLGPFSLPTSLPSTETPSPAPHGSGLYYEILQCSNTSLCLDVGEPGTAAHSGKLNCMRLTQESTESEASWATCETQNHKQPWSWYRNLKRESCSCV